MRRKRPTEAPGERHRRAVAQTIQWAKDAAVAGHYQDALSWMRVLEAVEGELPRELERLRDRCLAITVSDRPAGARVRPARAPA
jgi:hypothetical protein